MAIIQIDSIEPAVALGEDSARAVCLENETMYVRFSVQSEGGLARPTIVDMRLVPAAGPPVRGDKQWRVPSLPAGTKFPGVLAVDVPRAGMSHVVELTLAEQDAPEGAPGGTVLASARGVFDSALLVSFRLDRFRVRHPRKKILWVGPMAVPSGIDDVWASLAATRGDGTVMLEPQSVHVGLTRKGQTREIKGSGPDGPIDEVTTPPLVVLPREQGELSVSYSLANQPHIGEASEKFFNGLSKATAALLTTLYGGGAVWKAVDSITQKLNDWQFDDCSGFTAVDTITFTGRAIEEISREGLYEETRTYTGDEYKARWISCGIGPSAYEVTWQLVRVSGVRNGSGKTLDVVPSQQLSLASEGIPLRSLTGTLGLEWTVEGGANRASIVDDRLVPAPGSRPGDIIVAKAHEAERSRKGDRHGTSYIGLLP